jgi:hypothetical protein
MEGGGWRGRDRWGKGEGENDPVGKGCGMNRKRRRRRRKKEGEGYLLEGLWKEEKQDKEMEDAAGGKGNIA